MQPFMDRGEIPGCVALVAHKGRVVYHEAHGYRDIEAEEPMTTDTIFRIASMTKPITSVAAMMLVDQGMMALDDPISKWLPDFKDAIVSAPEIQGVGKAAPLVPFTSKTDGLWLAARTTDGYEFTSPTFTLERPITVRHLLTHTSGLSDDEIDCLETSEELTRLVAKEPLKFQPGEKWDYNCSTDVLGHLIEVVSGQNLRDFFVERIFEPLGMHDTDYVLPGDKLNRLATLYSDNGEGNLVRRNASAEGYLKQVWGSSGLVSTASDYYKFLQMLLDGGHFDGKRILRTGSAELLMQNQTGDMPIPLFGPGYGFSLGFFIVRDGTQTGLGLPDGCCVFAGACNTFCWIDPQKDLIAIFLTQVRLKDGKKKLRSEMFKTFIQVVNQAITD